MPTTVAPPLVAISFEDTSVAFASKTNTQLQKTYWIFSLMNHAWLVGIGTFFIKLGLLLKLPIKWLIKSTVFAQFCGGENIKECNQTIQKLAQSNIGTILDYSVEGEDDEKSFEKTAAEIKKTIEKASQESCIPFSVFKLTGIASAELIEKIQRGTEPLTTDEQEAYQQIKSRLDMLCRTAHDLHVKIFVDAEESWIQDTIDMLVYEAMSRYNRQQPIVYNTYQMYRSDMYTNLQKAIKVAKTEGYFLGAKLVRGAYFEKERARAHEEQYEDPIHATKPETDHDFDAAIELCINNRDMISICLGTHNEYSCHHCINLMQQNHIAPNDPHIWFAQLLGMSDNISYNLANAGYNVAKYVPYGPVEAVMPYLFRRANENKSIAGQSSREYLLTKREVLRRSN
jgi:proline dehydrogenase